MCCSIRVSNIEPMRAITLMKRYPVTSISLAILICLVLAGALAPWLGTISPAQIAPAKRLQSPSVSAWFGTDMLGRDVYSRVLYGSRVSLLIGLSVAFASSAIGLVLALMTSFIKVADSLVMRFMDGLMSIPPVLLAISLMALTRASITNVIVAITLAEIPRVVRLTRSVVLSLRDQPFVEAAIGSGTSISMILFRHLLPFTLPALVVQATYIFAAAMIIEAILSFLGAGTPAGVPSWGNIIADGRNVFQVAPHIILFPCIFLSLAVLGVNMLGNGLRDALDPRLAARLR